MIHLITRPALKLSKIKKISLAAGKLIATKSVFPMTKIAQQGDRVVVA